MKKIYTLFVLMLMPLMAFAQTSRTINVATAGTLPDLISDEEKYTIDELTLTGELNGTDFRLLRDMAGNNYLGESTDGKLIVLDLSGASIVAGGEKYLDVDMINNSDLMKGSGPCHLSIETNNTLPNYCFASCKLERLILPDNLTTIDFNGLSYLTKMTYIHLPKSLISIVRGRWSINPFVDCVNLQEIDVDPLNEVYTSIDGVLFSKDGKTLMSYPASKSCDSYDIPSSVTTLFGEAFYYSKNVLSMSIPNGVSGIPDRTFSNSSVSSITIPSSIKSIGNYSFGGCNLGSITFSEGLESIGDGAFWGNKQLESVSIPSTVTQIGANPFRSCENLQRVEVKDGNSVYDSRNNCNAVIESASNKLLIGCSSTTIPDDIQVIGSESFYGNKGLKSITIPSSVSEIESYAFNECRNLSTIVLPNTITSIGRYVFSFTNLTSVKIPEKITVINENTFFSCTKLVEVILPENLSEIRSEAFSSCWNLNSVKIPSSVTAIGEKAFYACKGLSVVMSDIEEPFMISDDVFALSNGFSTATLCVPVGCASKYQATDGWKLFTKIVEPIDETYDSDLETPLTFEAIEGKVQISFYNRWGGASFPYKYRIDDGPWLDFTVPFDGTSQLPLSGKIVRLKSQGELPYGFSQINSSGTLSKWLTIKCDADCYVYGNVMSLNKGDDFASNTDLGTSQNFGALFRNNTHLRNHPEKALILPSTTLTSGCYVEMFKGCTGLTRAPELPAMTLETSCYESMFEGCTNLAKAPNLPATTVTQKGYYKMFKGCTSITSSPSFPSTPSVNGGAQSCYSNMFEGCTSLVEGPEALGLGNKPNVYIGMFKGCTSLTSAPRLTATLVHEVSYSNMFEGCTSLKIAPELPATQLKMFCYANMFKGCTSLVEVPKILPAKGMKWDCYSGMFEGCTSLTKAPELPSTSLDDNCYTNMFSGCTSLTEAPELPAEQLVSGCYTGMFKGCSNLNYVDCKATSFVEGTTTGWLDGVASTGTFRKPLSMTTWPKGVDGIPEGWTVEDLESISVGSSGYSTYNNEGLNLDFSETEEMKAYVATGYDYDMNTIWLTRVKDVPAGMPIMVKGSINTGYDIPVEEVSVSYFVNMFVANNTGSTITLPETSGDMTNYYLSNGIFNSSTGDNPINPGKCYLQIPTVAPTHTVGSSQTVKMNGDGFASFCGSQDLDFTDVEGLKAYAATGYDDATGTIWLTRVKRVSAGTGLLLKGAPSSEYTIPSIGVRSYYANMMVGNQTNSDITIYTTSGDMTNYYLKGNKLLKADDKKGNPIYPGKAYMQIPSKHVTRGGEGGVMPEELPYRLINEPEVIPMQVLTRALGGEDDGTTDIREITQPERIDNVFYNLQGQRVDKPTRGLYIRNGKVIVIK